jgi:hypothetical protein
LKVRRLVTYWFHFCFQRICLCSGDAELAREVDKRAKEVTQVEAQVLDALEGLGHIVRDSTAKPAQQADMPTALKHLEAVFPLSPYSPVLHAAKAEALLRLGLLVQAKSAAAAPLSAESGHSTHHLWSMWIATQVTYHQGDVEATVQQLQTLGERVRQDTASRASPGFAGGANATLQAHDALLHIIVALPSIEQACPWNYDAEPTNISIAL